METIRSSFEWLTGSRRGTPNTTPAATPRSVSPAPPEAESRRELQGQADAPAPPEAAASCPENVSAQTQAVAPAETTEAIAKIERFEVAWQNGVHVRAAKERSAESLGIREEGTIVFGRQDGDWVALSDEPGFMVVSDGGIPLLKKMDQEPDLEAMMQAAETRRLEVEAQASRLVALLSGVRDGSSQPNTPRGGNSSQPSTPRGGMSTQPNAQEALTQMPPQRTSTPPGERPPAKEPSSAHALPEASGTPAVAPSTSMLAATALSTPPRFPEVVTAPSPATMAFRSTSPPAVASELFTSKELEKELIAMGVIPPRTQKAPKQDDKPAAKVPATDAPSIPDSPLLQARPEIQIQASPILLPPPTPSASRSPAIGSTAPVEFPASVPASHRNISQPPLAQSTAAPTPWVPPDRHAASEPKTVPPWNSERSPATSSTSPPEPPTVAHVAPRSVSQPPSAQRTEALLARVEQEVAMPQLGTMRQRLAERQPPILDASPQRASATIRSRSGPGRDASRSRGELSDGTDPDIQRLLRRRLDEAKGKVDTVLQNMSEVQGRLGSQENRLSSLTHSLRDFDEVRQQDPSQCSQERGRQLEPRDKMADAADVLSRAASRSLRPEVRELFGSMVEEMHHISELAVQGEQAAQEVESARINLEDLAMETTALTSKSTGPLTTVIGGSQGSELAEAVKGLRSQVAELLDNDERRERRMLACMKDLGSLQVDMGALKEQLRCLEDTRQGVEGTKCLEQVSLLSSDVSAGIDERLLLTSDVSALRGTLADTASMLRSELCQIASEATQSAPDITRQDLEDLRQDLVKSVSLALQSFQEFPTTDITNSISDLQSRLDKLAGDEVATTVSDLQARLEKAAGDALDARRGIDSLQEDMAAMQTSKIVTQQELTKATEFMSKEFRLMLDMTMNNYHTATRQELAQTSSQLRRELRPLADFGANEGAAVTRKELTEAVEQLRLELSQQAEGRDTKEASKHWGELVGVVENLLEDVAQLGEKTSRGEQAASAELAEVKRILAGSVEDVGIMKAQGRLKDEEAKLGKEDVEQLATALRSEQRQALEGLRTEVMLNANLQQSGGGSVSRQELVDVVETLRQEVSNKVQQVAGASSGEKYVGEVAETSRILTQLSEDATREKAAVQQQFRSLRQELILAVEELRSRLPSRLESPAPPSPSPFPSPQSPGLQVTASTVDTSAVLPEGRGAILEAEKDFGELRYDLNSLRTRHDFLKRELKCLVDTTSRA